MTAKRQFNVLTIANCLSCLLGQTHWRFLDILCSVHVLPQTCQAFIRPYPSKRGHEMLRLPRAFHQHMFYASSTYVLRLINICSTSHQHMFYVSSTYVLLSSSYVRRLINICSTSHRRLIYEGSTSHLRLIYEGSTSHLRRIDVSSTRDRRYIDVSSTRNFEEKRKYMFRLSPNQVLLAAFSCTKQVDGKPKQLA